MKKMIAGVLVGCSLLVTGAQADNGWGLHWAYWNPSDGKAGFGPGFKLALELTAHAQVDLRAGYFNKLEMRGGEVRGDIEVYPLELGMVYCLPFNELVDVYAGVGVGYYLMDGKVYDADGTRHGADPGDQIGYFASLGLELALARDLVEYGATHVSLMIEGMYRMVEGGDMDRPDGSGRLRDPSLNGPVVNVGLMVRW